MWNGRVCELCESFDENVEKSFRLHFARLPAWVMSLKKPNTKIEEALIIQKW